ncbi:MAG: hypothetical protein IJ761_02870 [Bacteroidales bacterium]|nr:hypothetical protein [Bacteroidales bacterium]
MKKVFFAMAVAGMFAFAACKSNNNAEEANENVANEPAVENVAAEETEANDDGTVMATEDVTVEAVNEVAE